MSSPSAYAIGMLISAVPLAACLINACRVLVRFTPSSATAFAIAILTVAIEFTIGFVVGIALAAFDTPSTEIAVITALGMGIVVRCPIYGRLLKHPTTGPVGLWNGCRLVLLESVFRLALFSALSALLLLALIFLRLLSAVGG